MSTETKVCGTCLVEKPIAEFWITDKKRGYRRRACKECDRATARKYYEDNETHRENVKARSRLAPPKTPEAAWRHGLMSKYGLTVEQYDAMLAGQGGMCALCLAPAHGRGVHSARHNGARHYAQSHWNVDHCHETGRVRGLLCHKCNVRVGAYEGLLRDIGIGRLVAYLARAKNDLVPRIKCAVQADEPLGQANAQAGSPADAAADPRERGIETGALVAGRSASRRNEATATRWAEDGEGNGRTILRHHWPQDRGRQGIEVDRTALGSLRMTLKE
jgi:Recombination endonuclease VII